MPSQPKFATQIEQPHDEEIELLKAKSIKRTDALFDRVQAGKGMGNGRLIDQLVSGEPPQEIRGAARTRVTRSSSGLCEFEDDDGMLIQRRTIAPKNFYSTANELQPDGHHGPRSSIRAAKQTPLYRRPQESFEETPKIERWTMVNPNWSDGWQHSIVYPPTGKNRATVDKQDIERLDEGEFLNDSLINFYLRWLEHHLLPQLANRVYFHNTYFYKTLTTGKQRSINYEAVERWTAKVDLLSYDYIVVPVNEYTHWYVAIICNAPRLLARDGDRSMKRSVSPQAGDAPVRPTESSRSPLQSSKLALVSDQEVELMKGLSLHDAFDEERDGRSSPEHGLNPVSTSLTTLSNDVAKANAINQKPKRGSNRQSPISIPNSFDKERDFEEIGPESVMLNTVTAEASARKPSTPKKGRRKYGGLTSRKHNPKEPKIITLDSLGVKHSPTCTNLRNYVVAEIKSKKGIEIPPPGALGTTATNIPQQNNHCDCGLFLLSYVEKFVENPDEFYKHAIENTNDGTQWLAASAMRNKIRDLLFTLQEHQIAEAEGLRQKKGKGKKDIKESEKPKASIPVDMVETPNTASAGPTSDPPDLAVPSKTRLHDLQQELPVQIVTHDRKRSASTEPVKPVGDTKRSRIQAQSAQIAPETRSRPEYNIPREIHELDHDSQEVDEILPILHERTQKVPTSEVRFSVEVQALDVDIQRSGMSAAACLPKSGTRSVGIDEVSSVQKSNNNPDPPHLGRTRGSAVVIQESPEKSSDQRKSHRSSENPPTTITSARNLPLAGAKAQRNKIHPRQPPFRSSVQLNGEHDEPDGRPGSSSSHSSTLDNIGMPNAARAITQSINDAEMLLDSGGSGETGGVNDVYGADTLSSPDVSLENTSPPAVRTHSHSPPKLQASHQIQNGLESHRIGSHGTRSEHRSWQQTHPGSNEVAHIAGAYGVHTRAFQ
jgi:Ulp1 family protease